MKNIPIITFIIPLFIFSFIKLYSQEKPPSIEVYSTAIIKVVPDKMNWNINVQVEMDDVKEAKIQNDKSVSKVLNILEDEGIPSKEIQTGGIKNRKKI
ncbi:SIMPL domain-containing protein [Bacteroidota bacterium]